MNFATAAGNPAMMVNVGNLGYPSIIINNI